MTTPLTPEEQLRQQVVIARSAHQQQRLSQHKLEQSQNQNSVSLGYNAAIGADEVLLADGSILYANSNSNGSRGTGDALELHQGAGIAHVDTMLAPKQETKIPSIKLKREPHAKVLFSIIENELRNFYIGGDRATPIKIFSMPTTLPLLDAHITNTESREKDWIVGIRYVNTASETITKNLFGANLSDLNKNWEDTNVSWIWRQWGFWTQEEVAPLPNAEESLVSTFTKYEFSNVSPVSGYTLENTFNSTQPNPVNPVRIYEPSLNPVLNNYQLDVDNINALGQLTINQPTTYLEFPIGAGGYQGTGIFTGLKFEGNKIGFTRFTSRYGITRSNLTFQPGQNNASGEDVQIVFTMNAGQGNVFGDRVDEIGNGFSSMDLNLNGTIKYKARLNSAIKETQGTTKYYVKKAISTRKFKSASGVTGGDIDESASHSIKESSVASILLFNLNSLVVEPGLTREGETQKSSFLDNKYIKKVSSTLTSLTSKQLSLALCTENILELEQVPNPITFFNDTIVNVNSVKYFIYNKTGQKTLIQDAGAQGDVYTPDPSKDTLMKSQGLKIVRFSEPKLTEVLAETKLVSPEVFKLTLNNGQYILTKQVNPKKVKIRSLRIGQNSNYQIHSASYHE